MTCRFGYVVYVKSRSAGGFGADVGGGAVFGGLGDGVALDAEVGLALEEADATVPAEDAVVVAGGRIFSASAK